MVPALFFKHYAAEPEFNMAFDEWLFFRAQATPGAIFLRLYSWNKGAITLGVNQCADKAVDFSKIGDTKVIRRITGGRAVFHDLSEITYALAVNPHAPGRERFRGSVTATSTLIAEALQRFLCVIDIDTVRADSNPTRNLRPGSLHKVPCFISAARNELIAGGKKIVASAQRQIRGVLLQHGSIKISGLAAHPALPDLPARCFVQPLGPERFDYLAELFCRHLGLALKLTIESAEELLESEEQFKKQLARVRREPLSSREGF